MWSHVADADPHFDQQLFQTGLTSGDGAVGGIRKSEVHYGKRKPKYAQNAHQHAAIGNGHVGNLEGGFSILRHVVPIDGEVVLLMATEYHNLTGSQQGGGVP